MKSEMISNITIESQWGLFSLWTVWCFIPLIYHQPAFINCWKWQSALCIFKYALMKGIWGLPPADCYLVCISAHNPAQWLLASVQEATGSTRTVPNGQVSRLASSVRPMLKMLKKWVNHRKQGSYSPSDMWTINTLSLFLTRWHDLCHHTDFSTCTHTWTSHSVSACSTWKRAGVFKCGQQRRKTDRGSTLKACKKSAAYCWKITVIFTSKERRWC